MKEKKIHTLRLQGRKRLKKILPDYSHYDVYILEKLNLNSEKYIQNLIF